VSDPIRWGIAGTGRIAAAFVQALAEVDDASVVAVGSNSTERAAAFAAEHAIGHNYGAYEGLGADEGVDVVYVASTQERHVDDVLLFLEAGRHVLCEKPFALSVADAQRMVAKARELGLFLMEAMWSRFLPSYVRLAQLLDERAIGDPQLLEANFSFRMPDSSVAGHRLFDPQRGGGALFDLGVYPVQLAHLVFGAPDTVAATATLSPLGIDEQTSMLLGYNTGQSALLHAATRVAGTCGARIVGAEGVIELAPHMHCTRRLTVTRDGDTEVLDFAAGSLGHQVPEVHRCIRSGLGESPLMPHAETISILTTLERARRQIGLNYPERPAAQS